jgi:hypothetical protein
MKELRTKSWPKVTAQVVNVHSSSGISGLTVVNLAYKYSVNGSDYEGDDNKPFFSRDSESAHLHDHAVGSEMVIVVNPKDPSQSFLREPFWIS